MAKFTREIDKKTLLAQADYLEQELNWRKVRVFFKEMVEFAPEFSCDEIIYLLNRCCDMMEHPKSQVRRLAGGAAGQLVPYLGDAMPKVWEDALHRILFPGEKGDEKMRSWLPFSLMQMTQTVTELLGEKEKKQFLAIYAIHFRSVHWSRSACINLLSGILRITQDQWSPLQKHEIFGFIRQFLRGEWEDVTTLSLLLLNYWKAKGWKPQEDELRYLQKYRLTDRATYAQKYLLQNLVGQGEASIPEEERLSTAELILRDMHPKKDWALILAHLMILKERCKGDAIGVYADHLRNLMRLNSNPMVFLKVGEELLAILPGLDQQAIHEIQEDVMKELEMGVDSANFAASFLGRGYRHMAEADQLEYIERAKRLVNSNDDKIVMTMTEALCVACAEEKKQSINPGRGNAAYGQMQASASGGYSAVTRASALPGKQVITQKAALQPITGTMPAMAGLISKIRHGHVKEVAAETEFLMDYYSIREEICQYGPHYVDKVENECSNSKKPIAFFTATFDPFTTRDKAIVMEMQERGFEVCIGLSDFDWQGNLQPSRIRRQLLEVSVADLKDVQILPEDITVYMANRKDLEKLRTLFPNREIWLVVENTALSEAMEVGADFPHIVYSDYEMQGRMDYEAIRQVVQGDVEFLQLPARYQNVTAQEVQRRVLKGRRIGGYVDAHVERIIDEWQLYLNRSFFKQKARTDSVCTTVLPDYAMAYNWENGNYYYGRVAWRKAGKTAVITSISGDITAREDYRRLALLELLLHCQAQGFAHMVCFDAAKYQEFLEPCGFRPMEEYEDGVTLDLDQVIVLFLDMESAIDPDYLKEPRVIHVIRENQIRLADAVSALYPGKLILSLPTRVLNDRLMRLIGQNKHQKLLCVPFGKILKHTLIPDVMTSELNTEKCYRSDLSSFDIVEFPKNPSIRSQIRTLGSFDRPVLLADDLFHKGFRYEKITQILKEEQVPLHSLVVSILSGRGEKLAKEKGIQVKTVYRVPNMKVWLQESDLYPFVGGDGLETETKFDVRTPALHSINNVLPYEIPPFMGDVSLEALYHFSQVSLENDLALFTVLEDIYRMRNQRTLNLERLQEVMLEPRYPTGISLENSRNKKISVLLQEELQKLARLRV